VENRGLQGEGRGSEDKVRQKKAEEVKMAKQEDSGSDSSWFMRDAGESIQE
jgi:hypothetical protein